MISAKVIINLCVSIVLAIGAPKLVCASVQMVKFEEPFPPRIPLQAVSKVAFTQYLDVPMLSLEEIETAFPWLKLSDETDCELRRSAKTGSRYIFRYVPTELTDLSNLEGEIIGSKFQPRVDEIHKLDTESVRRGKETKMLIKQLPKNIVNEVPISRGRNNGRNKKEGEELRYERHRERNKINNRISDILSALQKDDEKSGGIEERKNRLIQYSETRQIPSYLYPKVPSRYMQPPRIQYEDEEFWIKKKRHPTKRPTKIPDADQERLKNHKIVKNKKSPKTLDAEKDEDLKNHKPMYDREHDPEERAESSNSEVEKTRNQRPSRKKPKNNSLISKDGERVQFQIHGHEGPQTYIFGYDTGDGENRHFRIEERLSDGSVRGHYGYYDSNGKLKMVEYKANPTKGYEEEHHKSGKKTDEQIQQKR